ncbi:thioredoxin reductase glit [Exophiala viscosa]|uniref:thioredoxin reductase glit n=1 Tax=Exophiala viscosa TaxID=2486360 RepID=UPI0021914E48|nr:thioredoxin reductase glit [Exophiala viscosa]
MASTIYDALIVGAGPAGLSAALGLSRVHRSKVVFTKPLDAGFRNEGAEEMHNVLSRDCTPPADFRQISKDQNMKYSTTEFVAAEITFLKKIEPNDKDQIALPSHFEALDRDGRKWHGRKIVLATGSVEVLPTNIPGYKENWPQNIFQCLFCDGHERSHLPFGMIGFSPMHAHAAQMANLLVTKTSGPPTIFSNGPIPETESMLKALESVKALGCKVETGKIDRLVPAESPEVGVTVHLEDGKSMHLGFLTDKPPTVLASRDLIDQLGLEVESHSLMGEHIKDLELGGTTKVSGVFVVGDAGTPMKAVANAISSGANAAANLTQQLVMEDLQKLLTSRPN